MADDVFGSADFDKSKQQREKMEYQGGQAFFTPKAGESDYEECFVRILPPLLSMNGSFYHAAALHFLGPPVTRTRTVVLCPRREADQECPVCDAGFELNKAGQKDAAKNYWPSVQGYMNVVVCDKKGQPVEEEVRIWSGSRAVIDQLLANMEEWDDITSLDSGRLVRVRRKWRDSSKNASDYMITVMAKPSKFGFDWVAEKANDLLAVNPMPSAEELVALMAGKTADPLRALPAGEAAAEEPEDEEPEFIETTAQDVSKEETTKPKSRASAKQSGGAKEDGTKQRLRDQLKS